MCLAIPGEVLSIDDDAALCMGRVRFGGVIREVCLACVPEVAVGDFVVVHAGFAISRLNTEEAHQTLEDLGL